MKMMLNERGMEDLLDIMREWNRGDMSADRAVCAIADLIGDTFGGDVLVTPEVPGKNPNIDTARLVEAFVSVEYDSYPDDSDSPVRAHFQAITVDYKMFPGFSFVPQYIKIHRVVRFDTGDLATDARNYLEWLTINDPNWAARVIASSSWDDFEFDSGLSIFKAAGLDLERA